MERFARLAVLFLAAGVCALSSTASAQQLRLGYSTWAAWGPFFIAREKGWFAEEGIKVEFVRMEDASVRAAALAVGDLDATALTLDAAPLFLRPGLNLKFVFALASSRGGDAMLAVPEIETIADLKGRTVAVSQGTPAEFFVSVVLRSAGLDESDVTFVDLLPGDAGDAFVEGRVDAAMTWEPWISRVRNGRKGHLLTDTASHPGLITDMLVSRDDRLRDRAADFRALYRAWNRAVAFTQANPAEATAIMADGVGGWLGHEDVFDSIRAGIVYFDGASNELFFGEPDEPGLLTTTVGRALEVWGETGKLAVRAAPSELVSREVVGR